MWCGFWQTYYYLSDVNSFSKNGGLKAMGESLDRGMVFVMSLWDDHYVSNCGTFCDEMLHDRFIFSFHQANKNLDIFHSLLQLTVHWSILGKYALARCYLSCGFNWTRCPSWTLLHWHTKGAWNRGRASHFDNHWQAGNDRRLHSGLSIIVLELF